LKRFVIIPVNNIKTTIRELYMSVMPFAVDKELDGSRDGASEFFVNLVCGRSCLINP
jgi:hypothetical protein